MIGLLHVAVAAQALERLVRVRRLALAHPVLDHRRREPPERASARRPRRRRRTRASRRIVTVAASDSMARSATTSAISGWSTSSCRRRAGARRAAAACATAWRMPAAAPITQSSRVWVTISMIVRTPRPSSPTSAPTCRRARSRSTRSSGCRACPSGAGGGTRCASRRAASGAEEARTGRPGPGRARGTRRTSARSRTTCGR